MFILLLCCPGVLCFMTAPGHHALWIGAALEYTPTDAKKGVKQRLIPCKTSRAFRCNSSDLHS